MAEHGPTTRTVMRTVLIAVAVAISLYLIWLLRKPIAWLFISAFLAVTLSAPVNRLAKRMKRGLAIGIVFRGLIAALPPFLPLPVPPIVAQGTALVENAPR